MKYGILGDIHSNIQALEAVMAHLQSVGADRLLSVGDIVGYGANPIECIELLRSMDVVVVSGNHDQAVTGKLNDSFFNLPARAAVANEAERREGWQARPPAHWQGQGWQRRKGCAACSVQTGH